MSVSVTNAAYGWAAFCYRRAASMAAVNLLNEVHTHAAKPCGRPNEVQAFVATGVGNVIFDLVVGDRLIAQITLKSLPVARIDGRRKRDRQSAVLDALQDARAHFALG